MDYWEWNDVDEIIKKLKSASDVIENYGRCHDMIRTRKILQIGFDTPNEVFEKEREKQSFILTLQP